MPKQSCNPWWDYLKVNDENASKAVCILCKKSFQRQRGGRAPEVHCYATPIYNLGKSSLTDEFFQHISVSVQCIFELKNA